MLLKAAYEIHQLNFQNKGNSWLKIVHFLLKITDSYGNKIPSTGGDQAWFMKLYKLRLINCFENWWKNQISNSVKLDFYSTVKKHFRFESYLDNLDRDIRLFVTRLRISSHNLPVEIGRYRKEKMERNDRKCDICAIDDIGDESHYLLRCKNHRLSEIRNTFLTEVKSKVLQLRNLTDRDIIQYCLTMGDETLQLSTGLFIKKILVKYREEKAVPPLYILCSKVLGKEVPDSTFVPV